MCTNGSHLMTMSITKDRFPLLLIINFNRGMGEEIRSGRWVVTLNYNTFSFKSDGGIKGLSVRWCGLFFSIIQSVSKSSGFTVQCSTTDLSPLYWTIGIKRSFIINNKNHFDEGSIRDKVLLFNKL